MNDKNRQECLYLSFIQDIRPISMSLSFRLQYLRIFQPYLDITLCTLCCIISPYHSEETYSLLTLKKEMVVINHLLFCI